MGMRDIDLPEPQRVPESPEQRRLRRERLHATLFLFAASYSLVHKVLIPIFLKGTSLFNSPHAKIDTWAILIVAGILAVKIPGEKNRIRLPVHGAIVIYGLYEVFRCVGGTHQGWVLISKLLSSVPVGACAAYWLSRNYPASFKLKTGTISTALFAVIFALSQWIERDDATASTPVTIAVTPPNSTPHSNAWRECGLSEAVIGPALPQAARQALSTISIKSCGLSPSLAILSQSSGDISNETDRAMNLHFMTTRPGIDRLRNAWNVVLRPNAKIRKKKFELLRGEVGILYSDSNPAAGMTILLNADDLHRSWEIQRNPLRIREIKP